MNYTISNQQLTLTVASLGAEMQSIKNAEGLEYLWQGDPQYWRGRAYNLFPYCARLTDGKYYFGNELYQMKIHGLARYHEFEVVKQASDELTFAYHFDEESLQQFPWKFIFNINYKLVGKRINISFEVFNQDPKEMIFGIGGHPGFNVPLNKGLNFEDYYLDFAGVEEMKHITFSDDCYVTGEEAYHLAGGILELKHPLFDKDAIVLKGTNHIVSIKSKKDKHALSLAFPDMAYIGLWHKPETDAPYVCLEPWATLPSREGVVEHFESQPGLLKLAPNKKYTNNWYIEIV